MSARSAISLLAGIALVLAMTIAALALGQDARSAVGAPASFPAAPDADASRQSQAQLEAKTLTISRSLRPPSPPSYDIARVSRTLALRSRPGGAVDGSLGPSTEFGSPRVVGVAARRGDWLGLVTTARPNGRLAWVRREDPALRVAAVAWSLHADLSERTVDLRKGGRVVKRMRVAIGTASSPTPTGRFAVTDKLAGSAYGAYYGCCILALSGYQPHLPTGWQGGNRIAIHGTNAPSTIGTPASAGCLRAADADLAVLMRRVPLGTPVFIRA
jgi:L,D-transpeptidase-like protein